MNQSANQDPGAIFAAEFARRFALTLGGLLILVAARFRHLGDHTIPLWTRLNRASGRIARLMARLAAGPLTVRPSRPRVPAPILPGKPRRPSARAFSRSSNWLMRVLDYNGRGYASQLETLLNAPETAALLAAAPSAGRTLRPLCRLLGVTLPAILQLPPRPAPPPRPPRSPRAPRPARTIPRPSRSRIVLNPFGIPRTFPPSPPTRRKKPA